MHNKKIKGGVAMLALSAVLIGGTFAWLGSTDKVTNKFITASASDSDHGVDIWEKFTPNSTATPGTAVEKIVQVKNTAKYDSLIRVEMNAAFKKISLDKTNITLNKDNVITEEEITFNEDGTIENGKGNWVEVTENEKTYYYYVGNVVAGGFTDKILDSVTLSESVKTNPNYLGQEFNVDIDAYSVQSTAEAVTDKTDGKAQGATGEQLGFGLDATKHENLVKALQAVANGPATSCDKTYGTSATE
ncbi:hypothetical protein CHL78_009385 [Romboutsia weinsteinii]|uniref:Uncharacterized protein n=1 Tax=Romboutsia weinsteinii TaxID=2020949 RepID=A0A371J426_9FIRM|nr:BsaA family SipW-dependent biofilm matrix protein [Romboutsia weinsteinii]RDY27417.1 hypothetical protein CHL78_009385 [Romboutsia weinsteinii]